MRSLIINWQLNGSAVINSCNEDLILAAVIWHYWARLLPQAETIPPLCGDRAWRDASHLPLTALLRLPRFLLSCFWSVKGFLPMKNKSICMPGTNHPTLKAALFIHDSHFVWEACSSIQSLHNLSPCPCSSACCLALKVKSVGLWIRLISIVWVGSRSKTGPPERHRFSGAGTATP